MTQPEHPAPRVMIVDDEDAIREVLRRLLQRQGIDVCAEAADGLEAVDVATTVRPDIILMDLRMPNLDGLAATKEIKSLMPGVCVIMTTAYSDQAFRDEAEAAGVSAYLIKGTRFSEMQAAISAAWARHSVTV